jgi:hypothetical protein
MLIGKKKLRDNIGTLVIRRRTKVNIKVEIKMKTILQKAPKDKMQFNIKGRVTFLSC